MCLKGRWTSRDPEGPHWGVLGRRVRRGGADPLEEELFLQLMVMAGLSQMIPDQNPGSELRCAVSLLQRTQKYQFST